MKLFQLPIGSFGTVQGFVHQDSNIAEVRGIPYATVPERFRSPVLRTSLLGEVHDGTQFG